MARPRTGRKDRYAGKHVTFVDESSDVIKALKMQGNNCLRAAGIIYAKALAKAAPIHTGALSSAAGYRLRPMQGTPRLEVGFYTKGYGKKKGIRNYFANPAWLEFGTKPHILNAGWHRGDTGKKALANEDSGQLFGRRARHAGQAPRPFMSRTVQSHIAEAKAAQEKELAILSKAIAYVQDHPEVYTPYDATTAADKLSLRAWINEQRS